MINDEIDSTSIKWMRKKIDAKILLKMSQRPIEVKINFDWPGQYTINNNVRRLWLFKSDLEFS